MSDIAAELQEYLCSANKAIHLKLVSSEADVYDEQKSFHPEYTHQLFSDNEVIFGYRSLRVELYYCASRMTPYFSITNEGKVDSKVYRGVKADDIYGTIAQNLPEADFLTSKDQLIASLSTADQFAPTGQMLSEFRLPQDAASSYRVYKNLVDSPGFIRFHRRIRTFLLWFIDGSSFIDDDDDRWMFYTLFEVQNNARGDAIQKFVGFITVYNYYAYPDKVRPRVSQMLVLPPYQGKGLGAEFYTAVCADICLRRDVVDIAVEDPSDDFTKLRDFVDCRNCATLASFQEPHIHGAFSTDMAEEAREKFRLNKMQARRVYEILRLQHTNMKHPVESKNYRLMIKDRLNRPFQKQKEDMEKVRKHLSTEEVGCMMADISLPEQHKHLQQQYESIIEVYERIVRRMERV
eukprot:scpid82954/ scgid30758/ Histone acetyltransferase type B catalytic subunit; Histone acetyltransferase 1